MRAASQLALGVVVVFSWAGLLFGLVLLAQEVPAWLMALELVGLVLTPYVFKSR